MANIDDIAYAIGANRRDAPGIKDWFGKVVSVSPFKVARLGSEVGVECVNLSSASVDDMVYVLKRPDGQCVAIGKVGGGSTGLELLWENSSVSTTVGSITVDVDWTPYKFLFVECYTPAGAGLAAHTEVSVVSTNDPDTPKFVTIIREASIFRRIELRSGSIYISQGYWYREWNGSSPEVGNQYITPYRIYGVRELVASSGGGGGEGGTSNYNELTNKPSITEPVYGTSEYSTVTIQGNKTFDELGMHPFSESEIESLLTAADA